MTTPILQGMHAVAERYDGFVLDLWGVVHDVTVFPASSTHSNGSRTHPELVFLSNARGGPKSSQRNSKGSALPRRCTGVMSSGEATWRHLNDRPDEWYRRLGPNCLRIRPARNNALKGLAFEEADSVENADFILVTGPRDLIVPPNLMTICLRSHAAGPTDGLRQSGPGSYPRRRAPNLRRRDRSALSGARQRVRWHGKPIRRSEPCFELLGIADKSGILGIGDSFATDIKGANTAGLDALLVTRGIHGDDLIGDDGTLDGDRIAEGRSAASPSWALLANSSGERRPGDHGPRRQRTPTTLTWSTNGVSCTMVIRACGSVNVVHRLKDAGKQLIILSNSSRRAETTRQNMGRMEIDHTLADVIATGRGSLAGNPPPQDDFYRESGAASSSNGARTIPFSTLDLEQVDDIEAAEFVCSTAPRKISFRHTNRSCGAPSSADCRWSAQQRFRQHHA